jgi:biopolymer transport protein ExbD
MKYRVRKIAPVVPTASMADIAFLLIIFFMLTTSFSPERTNVSLPESEIQTEVSDEAAIVAITSDGEVFFTDGEEDSYPSDPAGVGVITRQLVELVPNKEFLIKADGQVRYETVDEVLEQLRTNGAKRIGMLTRPRASRRAIQ